MYSCSRQQEANKAAQLSIAASVSPGVATPGVFTQGQSSPPLPLMSQYGTSVPSVPSTPSTDVKSGLAGSVDIKEEVKTPVSGLGVTPSSTATSALTPGVAGQSGAGTTGGNLGFALSTTTAAEKDESKVRWISCRTNGSVFSSCDSANKR